MNNIEIIRIYQMLTNAKFDKVEKKEDRFALLDIVLTIGKDYDDFAEAEKKAMETIEDAKERSEYMERLALTPYTKELPSISKQSVYELIDSNNEHIALGAVALLHKLVK